MNKALAFLISVSFFINVPFAHGAVAVKKAAPVATKEGAGNAGAASLVPTVLGLVASVQELSARQKELTQDCIPTAQEITFVDTIMKEWAKTGVMSGAEVERRLNRRKCNGISYYSNIQMQAGSDDMTLCYDTFNEPNMIWDGYPKVGKAEYCPDGSRTCKNKRTVSDIYDIFNLIDFSEADYTKQELTMASKLIAKIEVCSDAKLSDKKRQMWGEFLIDAMGSAGQRTNTADIMQTVGNITRNGGGLGGLSSLGSVATQFLDK